ncbi:MAG: hypothetical protein ACYDEN_07835 [Acidimicrobiales bacterium]
MTAQEVGVHGAFLPAGACAPWVTNGYTCLVARVGGLWAQAMAAVEEAA